jgi:hypothetical protein
VVDALLVVSIPFHATPFLQYHPIQGSVDGEIHFCASLEDGMHLVGEILTEKV